VLYVEDDPDIAESLHDMLSELGLAVRTCAAAGTALTLLGAERFDVLLCDLELGAGSTAIDLLAAVRSQGNGIATLVLSAHGGERRKQASRSAGFVDHLVKPVDSSTLARALLAASGVSR
jgi:CheY-like chemotaxis protein